MAACLSPAAIARGERAKSPSGSSVAPDVRLLFIHPVDGRRGLLLPSALVFHHARQAEEIGAYPELSPLRRLGVALEAHPLALDEEIDAAAPRGESGALSHRQGGDSLERLEDFPRPRA